MNGAPVTGLGVLGRGGGDGVTGVLRSAGRGGGRGGPAIGGGADGVLGGSGGGAAELGGKAFLSLASRALRGED